MSSASKFLDPFLNQNRREFIPISLFEFETKSPFKEFLHRLKRDKKCDFAQSLPLKIFNVYFISKNNF